MELMLSLGLKLDETCRRAMFSSGARRSMAAHQLSMRYKRAESPHRVDDDNVYIGYVLS